VSFGSRFHIDARTTKSMGDFMFDRMSSGKLHPWLSDYQAKRWKRESRTYGHRFAFAGVAILVVIGLFVIA
jgi:hypothetical protein